MPVRCLILLCVFLLDYLASVAATNDSEILADPSPVNVSLNSDARFACVVENCNLVLWFANGKSVETVPGMVDTQPRPEQVGNDVINASIYFVVEDKLLQLNNSLIQCSGIELDVGSATGTNLSFPVKLMIQGKVSKPLNFSVNIVNNSVVLSWQKPFTLKGINIPSYIINTTIFNGSQLNFKECYETDVLEFSVDAFDNSSCTMYNICVQGNTTAGMGDPACANISRTEAPRKLKASEILIDVVFKPDNIVIKYTILDILGNCYGRQPNMIGGRIYHENGEQHIPDVPVIPDEHGELSFEAIIPKASGGNKFITILNLTNSAGSTLSETKSADPFYVESVEIVEVGETSLAFTCLYKDFSDPNGCAIEVKCPRETNTEPEEDRYYTNNSNTNYSTSEVIEISCEKLPCAEFNLYAYNIYLPPIGKDSNNPAVEQANISYCAINLTTASVSFTPTSLPGNSQLTPTYIYAIIAVLSFFTILLLFFTFVLSCCLFKHKCCKKGKEEDAHVNDVEKEALMRMDRAKVDGQFND